MKEFEDINYSIWCDFIERDFLENRFQEIINDEVIKGATSNPAIFEASITGSVAYKQQLDMLQANDQKKIYEELAFKDIRRAAELLEPLYKIDTNNGFISIEVDPLLCDDAAGTIEEGLRIYKSLNADNVMIKIPATDAGYIAMRELSSRGIHINATLIFSPQQARNCAIALDDGIKASNKDTKGVVSVFVSRFDRLMDTTLGAKGLATSKLGTGVKGNELSPTYYIDNLIYPNSVNTAPLGTIEDWLKDGKKEQSVIISEDECDKYFKSLEQNGIKLKDVYEKLLSEGLDAFKVSFKELLSKLKH